MDYFVRLSELFQVVSASVRLRFVIDKLCQADGSGNSACARQCVAFELGVSVEERAARAGDTAQRCPSGGVGDDCSAIGYRCKPDEEGLPLRSNPLGRATSSVSKSIAIRFATGTLLGPTILSAVCAPAFDASNSKAQEAQKDTDTILGEQRSGIGIGRR